MSSGRTICVRALERERRRFRVEFECERSSARVRALDRVLECSSAVYRVSHLQTREYNRSHSTLEYKFHVTCTVMALLSIPVSELVSFAFSTIAVCPKSFFIYLSPLFLNLLPAYCMLATVPVNVRTVRYPPGALLVRSRFALGTLEFGGACGAVRLVRYGLPIIGYVRMRDFSAFQDTSTVHEVQQEHKHTVLCISLSELVSCAFSTIPICPFQRIHLSPFFFYWFD